MRVKRTDEYNMPFGAVMSNTTGPVSPLVGELDSEIGPKQGDERFCQALRQQARSDFTPTAICSTASRCPWIDAVLGIHRLRQLDQARLYPAF